MSNDAKEDYFSDGVSDELINTLQTFLSWPRVNIQNEAERPFG